MLVRARVRGPLRKVALDLGLLLTLLLVLPLASFQSLSPQLLPSALRFQPLFPFLWAQAQTQASALDFVQKLCRRAAVPVFAASFR